MKDPQDLTVGKFLQQERERKGLSLEAVAKVTRIAARNLEAMESDDFAALPAPLFIRSFLKAYAAVIGVDANKVIVLYETQTGLIGVSSPTPPPPEKEFSRKILLVVIPVLVVLIVGGIYLFSSSSRKAPEVATPAPSPETAPPAAPQVAPPPPEPPPPVKEVPKRSAEVQKPPAKEQPAKKVEQKAEQRVPPPPPQKPSQPPASSAATAEEKQERRHILRVQAREQTWIKVQADEQPEFEVLLEPQEKAVWTARRQMRVILGNAGGVEMTFNGKKVGPFGETGQVVHLQFPLPEKKGE